MSQLHELYLYDLSGLGGTIPTELANLDLSYNWLNNNALTGSVPVFDLTRLIHLHLDNNMLTGTILQCGNAEVKADCGGYSPEVTCDCCSFCSVLVTDTPSIAPTILGSLMPSISPTSDPSASPSDVLTLSPSLAPFVSPLSSPTKVHSTSPTASPTSGNGFTPCELISSGDKNVCNNVEGCAWRRRSNICKSSLTQEECRTFDGQKNKCKNKGCVWKRGSSRCAALWK